MHASFESNARVCCHPGYAVFVQGWLGQGVAVLLLPVNLAVSVLFLLFVGLFGVSVVQCRTLAFPYLSLTSS
jgi:hypothetical protein